MRLLQPTDVLEWRTVTQEMENFLAADSLAIADSEGGGGKHASRALPIRCQLESPLAGVPFTVGFEHPLSWAWKGIAGGGANAGAPEHLLACLADSFSLRSYMLS